MLRSASLLVAALVLVACGDSTDSNGQAPGGGAGTDSGEVAPDSGPTTTDAEPVVTDPMPTDPPVTDPPVTEPVVTDPPVTDPPVTEPPPTAAPPPAPAATPTDRVVQFFAGDGAPGSPWVPLGHWDGTAWQSLGFTEDGAPIPPPPSPIATIAATTLDLPDGPDAVITGLALGAQEFYCVGDETGPVIDLPAELPRTEVSTGYNAVAVTADWPLQPRAVRQVGLQVPEYPVIGADLMAGEVGAGSVDGTVVQAVRVDLDGNGVEEVLVTYERQESPDFGGEGDFSSIYVRYPASDGTVVDELLVSYVSADPVDFPTPGRFTLAAVADLNGDGVMEVMVRDRFWESGGMQVFALVDGRLSSVAGGGCGV